MGFKLRKFGSKSSERAGRGGDVSDLPGQEADVLSLPDEDVSPEELYDFMSADALDVQADPEFKEALRRKLWAMVNDRYGRGRRHDL